MKKIISTIFCTLFLVAAVSAQVTIEFDHDTLHTAMPLDSVDKVAHNYIKNTSNSTKTFKWTREVIQIAPNCQSYICDPKACYLPQISTRTFTLAGNTKGTLDAHMKNNDPANLCCSILKLHLEEVNVPDNFADVFFYFNDCSKILDESEALALDLKIYPNPVQDFFTLENAEEVATLRVMSRDGREVKTFAADASQKYEITDLPTGQYFVVVYGKTGKAIRAIEILKG